ncbi:toprim domain-containing protein [Hymenobacter sp. GOD-10R]|uniref:toprim domain-containing protein n=1 Tax=Hymenobacter sp. GOD-10R TaxID=3093922 RepID=UPI002D76B44D|nr:toprim domain-containing protein [Hymenobacter sp. GOD-10R]WRQ31625.1 toprim domain-containing protein [Hymenobacter sp. GOD-10R]
MQNPREPELNFSQVKKELNMVDLVLTLGYQHNRAKSGSDPQKGKFHTFDYRGNPRLDQVIIYKAPSGDFLYFNRADDRDKGSVIDFLKFRLENPRIDGITAVPGKNIWTSVIENARRFLSVTVPPRQESSTLQKAIEPVQRGDQFIPDFLLATTTLTDTRYLNSRGISNETLTNACFSSRILNHIREGKTKDGQDYKFVNTAFPQLYKDKIVGLEIKANGFRGQAADSLSSSALWLSNSGNKTHTLIVSESAIDSLSHYQLKQPNNTMYASTAGFLTDNKVAEIRRLVENQNLKTVKAAFDNNLDGYLFDTKLITGLAHPTAAMRIERTLPGLITVGISSGQEQYFTKLHQETKNYNHRLAEGYYQVAGKESPGSTTLTTELITATKDADNSYKFHIPKRLETLAFFNQALISAYPMTVKLEVDKSRANDWNDQLKESLRSKSQAVATSQEPSVRRGIRR